MYNVKYLLGHFYDYLISHIIFNLTLAEKPLAKQFIFVQLTN
jgi:hypothetical protein